MSNRIEVLFHDDSPPCESVFSSGEKDRYYRHQGAYHDMSVDEQRYGGKSSDESPCGIPTTECETGGIVKGVTVHGFYERMEHRLKHHKYNSRKMNDDHTETWRF